jgi:hypothetical protein
LELLSGLDVAVRLVVIHERGVIRRIVGALPGARFTLDLGRLGEHRHGGVASRGAVDAGSIETVQSGLALLDEVIVYCVAVFG